MKTHHLIKARRQTLGWTDTQMAKRVGLSDMEYYDVEAHDDELVSVTPLMNVRRLAEAIDVPVHQLFGIGNPANTPKRHFRHERIVEARKKRGVTPEEMADQIGFTQSFVAMLESDAYFLEIYPYEVLETVANYLKIPPQDLL